MITYEIIVESPEGLRWYNNLSDEIRKGNAMPPTKDYRAKVLLTYDRKTKVKASNIFVLEETISLSPNATVKDIIDLSYVVNHFKFKGTTTVSHRVAIRGIDKGESIMITPTEVTPEFLKDLLSNSNIWKYKATLVDCREVKIGDYKSFELGYLTVKNVSGLK